MVAISARALSTRVLKRTYTPDLAGYILGSFLPSLAICWIILNAFGSTTPGALFEKGKYETELYVNVFPSYESSRNYRVPARVYAYTESDGGDDDSRSISWKYYGISSFRFPNGAKITIEDQSSSLALGEKVLCMDRSGSEWYIELTDKKPPSSEKQNSE